ncbi:silicon efflux transporter LSI2 isoform X2 [Cryptomeria japonica]|uniref:silicon efflux transporter LSI2 isoform X2 n=1 Tax=Cryptomeria japonica TaxID=3369 RepID=UPI0025AB9C15|nr:silicon efflux transporter LSI2 isoform X2 [Cryptomeria japonica]
MAMASTPKVVLGCIGFVVFWILAVFPAVPFLPIGRTAGSVLGALLMVIFQVLSPDQAYAAVDLPILGLLFGTMVVSVYLERADMFKYLGQLLSWRSRGGRDLLCRVSVITAITSALFTNDTCCVVLTEFVLKLCRQHNLPPQPFLLALASSANIGSSATPIGNPQNLLLSSEKDEEAVVQVEVSEEDVNSHRFSPTMLSHVGSPVDDLSLSEVNSESVYERNIGQIDVQRVESIITEVRDECVGSEGHHEGVSSRRSLKVNLQPIANGDNVRGIPLAEVLAGKEALRDKWKHIAWKTCVYLVTVGMLAALICGLNMSWSAIAAAIALVVLDFTDARPSLEKVSYSLLVFFSGMFITVDGFNKTGIPSALWDAVEPHAHINNALGLVILSVVIVVLSNLASNVPTVLLLGARVAASAAASGASVRKAWLILAWVSTVAGNLTLVGSAANLIVCEQARRTQFFGYHLSFWGHLKFGIPATLVVVSVGLPLIRS